MQKMNFHRPLLILVSSIFVLTSCSSEDTLFQRLSPKQTKVTFSNRITEREDFNILTFEYIYNGGGIALADFNKDGLQDLFFAGNMVGNQMYLNQGEWQFRDVTDAAGVEGPDRWSSGVSVVDINNDGWPDVYVCATTLDSGPQRANQLYINQGAGAGELPVFSEQAAAYGIADTSYTTNAAFFDYDNDGDLDLYLAVNQFVQSMAPNAYWRENEPRFAINSDHLYENRFDEAAGHPVFREVSKEAGIVRGGFTLGLNIVDINRDGWKDIYVSNDYNSPDMLFVNNGDGTFTDRLQEYLKHTCYSAMGMNIADMNNDGLADIFVLDMEPEDNPRRKAMLLPYNYLAYLDNERFSYPYQHVRNVLQLNLGQRPDNGELLFTEVGLYADIHATDWSWTPMLADFDHDQFRDIIVTNGFPKDITDHDFAEHYSMRRNYVSSDKLLDVIPSVKLHNYAFKNELDNPGGIPRFSKKSEAWGISETSFSNAAAYGDLDNDGDLDYVVNNINDSAFVFRNMIIEQDLGNSNWLKVSLKGDKDNIQGIGAIIEIYYGGRQQMWENSPYRGYLSTVQQGAHFGLGAVMLLDSVRIEWPRGKEQVLYEVPANQYLQVDYLHAREPAVRPEMKKATIFREISRESGVDFLHPESDYIDYNVQKLLLHKLSQYGPGMAVSDVNGDGLDDFYVGGSHFNKGQFFLQKRDGTFLEQDLLPGPDGEDKREEELGVLFFDADGDGDEDLYLVSGGYEFPVSDTSYRDRLFLNDQGSFVQAEGALPDLLASGSCVRAADFDRDGDLDLFLGVRVLPHNYPLPVSSYLLINDGRGRFSIGNERFAPGLEDIGLISDALWTDYDNDGWMDLLLAGEWMPLTFLRNSSGKLDHILTIGEGDAVGWWNSLASGDFDMDGDMDYVAGNLGSNSVIRASKEAPVSVYAGDYDNDQRLDVIPSNYYVDQSGEMKEYPFHSLKEVEKQLKKIREIFNGSNEFGKVTMEELMDSLPDATQLLLKGNYQLSSYIENRGGGVFAVKELPLEAQMAPVFAILTGDFTGDQQPDILLTGNDYGNEVFNGRYDALNGLLLRGDGTGNFETLAMQQSGILIPGDGKSLVKLQASDSAMVVISGQNRGKLGMFKSTLLYSALELEPGDQAALVHLKDGRTYKEEVQYGNTFLSQSTRRLWIPGEVDNVEIIDYLGGKRTVTLSE